jgi:hypothetical protein
VFDSGSVGNIIDSKTTIERQAALWALPYARKQPQTKKKNEQEQRERQ